jgi:hypothetical protein
MKKRRKKRKRYQRYAIKGLIPSHSAEQWPANNVLLMMALI